jgi:hypothetical protein
VFKPAGQTPLAGFLRLALVENFADVSWIGYASSFYTASKALAINASAIPTLCRVVSFS